jgi:hypothetical protein
MMTVQAGFAAAFMAATFATGAPALAAPHHRHASQPVATPHDPLWHPAYDENPALRTIRCVSQDDAELEACGLYGGGLMREVPEFSPRR